MRNGDANCRHAASFFYFVSTQMGEGCGLSLVLAVRTKMGTNKIHFCPAKRKGKCNPLAIKELSD